MSLPILGIDAQARFFTGCMIAEETTVFQVNCRDDQQLAACRSAAEQLSTAIGYAYAEGVCWIEEPIGRWYKVIATQNRMIGALAAALPYGWSVDLVPPEEWKRLCGLPAAATKEQSIAAARLRLGGTPNIATEHHADAANIAYACQVWARPPEEKHG